MSAVCCKLFKMSVLNECFLQTKLFDWTCQELSQSSLRWQENSHQSHHGNASKRIGHLRLVRMIDEQMCLAFLLFTLRLNIHDTVEQPGNSSMIISFAKMAHVLEAGIVRRECRKSTKILLYCLIMLLRNAAAHSETYLTKRAARHGLCLDSFCSVSRLISGGVKHIPNLQSRMLHLNHPLFEPFRLQANCLSFHAWMTWRYLCWNPCPEICPIMFMT